LSNLYDTDFYQWTREQARLLSEGKWNELDVADLAEEIESLGKSERNALGSFLDVIVLHLLKLMYQPERTSRRWRSSTIEHRRRAHRRLRLSTDAKLNLYLFLGKLSIGTACSGRGARKYKNNRAQALIALAAP
jgi:hypothetical protein